MSRLRFEVLSAGPERGAVAPALAFRLRIRESTGERVHAIALRCQIQIEPGRRAYRGPEPERLYELFAEPRRWGETLRPFLWAHATAMVSNFEGQTETDLSVPCTYDFDVAAAKYLSALEGGDVPLRFLFSGMVFGSGAPGLAVSRVAWDNEAEFAMPVATWRATMDRFFPGAAWVRLSHDSFERLRLFKASRALTSWDEAVEELLAERREEVPA